MVVSMIRHGGSRDRFELYILCLKWILTVAVLTVAACKRSTFHDIVTTDTYTGTYVRNSYYIQNNFLIRRTSTHIAHIHSHIIHAFLVPEASIGKPKQDICWIVAVSVSLLQFIVALFLKKNRRRKLLFLYRYWYF